MWSSLRLIVVWLMVLALPAQGQAAALMQHCGTRLAAGFAAGAGHAGDRLHSPHEHQHHDAADASAAHALHAVVTHGDGRGLTAATAVATAGDESVPLADPGLPAGAHGCSACAACCVVLGLPAPAPVMPVSLAGLARTPIVTVSATSFLTTGPDRPPRTILD